MKRFILLVQCVFAVFLVRGQTNSILEYWYDNVFNDRRQITTSEYVVNVSELDVSALSAGIHTVNFRANIGVGHWTVVHTHSFYKTATAVSGTQMATCEYWVDDNFSSRVSSTVTGSTVLLTTPFDVSGISTGIHRFNIRLKDSNGDWSMVQSQIFYKLPVVSSGVEITNCEFWVDDNFSSRVSSTVSGSTVQLTTPFDVSGISTGIHRFNIRLKDSKGDWSMVQSQIFYKLPVVSSGVEITNCEYWVDDNFSSRVSSTVSGSTVQLTTPFDVSGASTGIHRFNIRLKDSKGDWSMVQSQIFYKLPVVSSGVEITNCEFWVDDNFSSRVSSTVSGSTVQLTTPFDVSGISTGIHRFNIRLKDSKGDWSMVQSQIFYKLPVVSSGVEITNCEYWVDDNFSSRVSSTVSGSTVQLTTPFDVSGISTGIHRFNIRLKDSKGDWSMVQSQIFFKLPVVSSGVEITNCEYWVDDNFSSRVSSTVSGSTVQLTTPFDVSGISTGIHRFNIRLKDSKGDWSTVQSQMFYQTGVYVDGSNKINAYRYWFDTDFGNQQLTELQTPQNHLSLSLEIDVPSAFLVGEKHVIRFQSRDIMGNWSAASVDTFEVASLATGLLNNKMEISVSPNPCNDVVNLRISGEKTAVFITIYELCGKMVMNAKYQISGGKVQIKLPDSMQKGLYILQMNNGFETIPVKLAKE